VELEHRSYRKRVNPRVGKAAVATLRPSGSRPLQRRSLSRADSTDAYAPFDDYGIARRRADQRLECTTR
jgi:hypothetical protein